MSEKLDLEIKEKGPKRKRIRKTLGSYCAAINCHNARRNSKLSMFRFPEDAERCKNGYKTVEGRILDTFL